MSGISILDATLTTSFCKKWLLQNRKKWKPDQIWYNLQKAKAKRGLFYQWWWYQFKCDFTIFYCIRRSRSPNNCTMHHCIRNTKVIETIHKINEPSVLHTQFKVMCCMSNKLIISQRVFWKQLKITVNTQNSGEIRTVTWIRKHPIYEVNGNEYSWCE